MVHFCTSGVHLLQYRLHQPFTIIRTSVAPVEAWEQRKTKISILMTMAGGSALTPETTVFLLTLVLGMMHLGVGAMIRIAELGPMTLLGPRDNLPPRENVFGIRGERANHNFKETLPWALGLLILVQITAQANGLTALGAWIYFWARVAYLPIYVFGLPVIRSLAFGLSLAGLGLMASQLL